MAVHEYQNPEPDGDAAAPGDPPDTDALLVHKEAVSSDPKEPLERTRRIPATRCQKGWLAEVKSSSWNHREFNRRRRELGLSIPDIHEHLVEAMGEGAPTRQSLYYRLEPPPGPNMDLIELIAQKLGCTPEDLMIKED